LPCLYFLAFLSWMVSSLLTTLYSTGVG
jgi:hypothetical protein